MDVLTKDKCGTMSTDCSRRELHCGLTLSLSESAVVGDTVHYSILQVRTPAEHC